jgi:hypothetical protein
VPHLHEALLFKFVSLIKSFLEKCAHTTPLATDIMRFSGVEPEPL